MGLLGPNGQPISSQMWNKKASPPKLGPSFGDWAGRDEHYMTLPGGGVVQFDLSKLELSDFRQMRDHYQVNASLAVLTFMQHQSDFHIECDDKRIADFCDEQMHSNWTMLNRALSTANWAGFSPNALEWDNDYNKRSVILSKIKDLVPEECAVQWKKENGWAPPGHIPPKFKTFDGIRQFGSSWPIPVENCVVPETLILCADLQWRKAGDLKPGDRLVAFDSDEQVRGRSYRTSIVEANRFVDRPCITIETKTGEPITVAEGHPFLVRRGPLLTGIRSESIYKDRWEWVKASDLKIGDQIGHFATPWEYDNSREAGYVAGIFDGEGSLSFTEHGGVSLSFTQREGIVLDRVMQKLDEESFKYTVHPNKRDNCRELIVRGGRREIMRFLEVFCPERLRDFDFSRLWDGIRVVARNGTTVTAQVTVISDAGVQSVANLQTSTSTYISAGYLSHNSFWYPMLMENGQYYGRKLLRPAFQSWFFSVLIHLFANRYYERFGEPVPIGRAPYDEDIDLPDNRSLSGNVYLLEVLQNLRNRSAVVLPNSGTQDHNGKLHYDYEIQYLESQMRGADFERYMTRLDEEISMAMFTPILLMRTADVGSYNLGQGHMQVYLWELNALNDDRAHYINNYILDKMVDYNFSENAPRAKIKFRKLGNSTAEMFKDVLLALIQQGMAKPDLNELGEMAGLKLTEIKQLTAPAPTPAPGADPNAPSPPGASARATAKDISNRVRNQVENALRDGSFDSMRVNMGYKRKMEKAFEADRVRDAARKTDTVFDKMDHWLADVVSIGAGEFAHADSFMNLFDRVLDNEIMSLVNATA